MDQPRQPAGSVDLNDRHQVEPKQCKVGKVILRQFLALQMSMDAPQASETVFGNARTAEIRQVDLFRGSDHYEFDLPLPVYKHTDLPPCLEGDLRHLAGQFGRNYRVGGYSA